MKIRYLLKFGCCFKGAITLLCIIWIQSCNKEHQEEASVFHAENQQSDESASRSTSGWIDEEESVKAFGGYENVEPFEDQMLLRAQVKQIVELDDAKLLTDFFWNYRNLDDRLFLCSELPPGSLRSEAVRTTLYACKGPSKIRDQEHIYQSLPPGRDRNQVSEELVNQIAYDRGLNAGLLRILDLEYSEERFHALDSIISAISIGSDTFGKTDLDVHSSLFKQVVDSLDSDSREKITQSVLWELKP